MVRRVLRPGLPVRAGPGGEIFRRLGQAGADHRGEGLVFQGKGPGESKFFLKKEDFFAKLMLHDFIFSVPPADHGGGHLRAVRRLLLAPHEEVQLVRAAHIFPCTFSKGGGLSIFKEHQRITLHVIRTLATNVKFRLNLPPTFLFSGKTGLAGL